MIKDKARRLVFFHSIFLSVSTIDVNVSEMRFPFHVQRDSGKRPGAIHGSRRDGVHDRAGRVNPAPEATAENQATLHVCDANSSFDVLACSCTCPCCTIQQQTSFTTGSPFALFEYPRTFNSLGNTCICPLMPWHHGVSIVFPSHSPCRNVS